jgi:hypothetical protein
MMNWGEFGRNLLLPSLRNIPTFSGETKENRKELLVRNSGALAKIRTAHHPNTNLYRYYYFGHSVVIQGSALMKFEP